MRITPLTTISLSLLTIGLTSLVQPAQAQTPSSRLLGQTTPQVTTVPSSSLGIIEASAMPAPAVLDLGRAQSVLNQANQYARVRAIRDQMRFQERRDLLLSDYVGNQNFNRATAGQQFGRLAWDTYYGGLPFTDY